MSDSEFVLKTTAPCLPRTAMARDRLLRDADHMFAAAAMAIIAPAGFGKTTVLLQWRQRWLEQGARVAWISADAQDDPVRFAALLLEAVRGIGSISEEDIAGRAGMEGLTALLAGIARRRVQVVVVVDDAERLPASTVEQVLQYLLLNAPANLHLAVGSRAPLPLRTAELLARERYRQLSVQDLRLLPEESLAILESRLGQKLGMDACMRLHDAAEGWPIGLQLAIAAIEQEADPVAAVQTLSARRGSLQDYFSDSMQAAFSGGTVDALARLAVLDRFNAELGELVCGMPVGDLLEQLLTETPIMIAGEDKGWFRLHPQARDYLLGLFERLPDSERADLHARASHWYVRHEHFHEAAAHAFAAGDKTLAETYASRALWALGAWGRVDEAREWLARIPAIVQSRDTHSRLSAAAILAFGERNAEGLRMAQDALSDPSTPPEMVLVALRVATSAAGFADQPGLMHALLVNWPPVPVEQVGPLYRFNQLNVMSYVALHAGDTDRLRALAAEAQSHGADRSLLLAQALSRMLVGLGHLWDGNPGRAVEVLHGPLLAAEREHGRRSMIACLLASILAQAFVQLDQHDAARLLLANRLDVIERTGFPDNVLAAYDALIHAALARGDEVSAMAALKGLDALAQRRQLPRLQLHTLAERIRLLALKGCNETVAGLLPGLDALVDEFEPEVGRPFHDQARLVAATTRAHAALASGHLAEADRQLDTAAVLAETTRRGRDACMVKVLRAVVARKRGESGAQALLLETINLAALSGNVRLLADTHPLALEMARELEGGVVLSHASASMDAPDRKAHVSESGLLTPKEEEILGLLERGMSNKRIALTLGIGAETVKWHLKNLFSKLSAGSREHAVERARLLGLVA